MATGPTRTTKELIREQAENDLESFISLVHPGRVLGDIHREVIRWWTRPDAKSHQLLLLPRDHGKSALVAYRVAWEITRNPIVRILYISATQQLAVKQLKFIKDILTSDNYRYYWPEMVSEDLGSREKWTQTEFSVDHPLRKIEAIRDPTVFTAGLTTTITGLHCDIAVLDDVVVIDNATTEDGRDKVETQYSLLSSIETSDAREWIVGTRYHPNDLYGHLLTKEIELFDPETMEVTGSDPLFEVMERQVETRGDGFGEFLWPRQQRKDGKWFGFNAEILAKKRAQYSDRTQFRAQYYNDPNDIENATITRDLFQYYDPKFLQRMDGKWYFRDRRLNVFAAVDFAFSLARRADYTCIVVVGVDKDNNFYVLEIDRFKTERISDYFSHILALHQKWDFRKLRADATSAQKAIVKDLKESYVRPHGLALAIDDHIHSRHEGNKEERTEAILQPKYQNRQIWHYRGGNCQTLEEELVLKKPPHDDVKDCLASAIDSCIAPVGLARNVKPMELAQMSHSRFGGIF